MATIGALRHRNFRLFVGGQAVSLIGTWMQTVAVGWVVLELTNSPFQVGLVSTLGSLPVLLFTLYGGVVADRANKHRMVTLLQAGMLIEAISLAVLAQTGHITVHWIQGLALLSGIFSAFEIPARQAFVVEMVGKEDLFTAVAINSTVFNGTRVIGPALAGVLLAAAGAAVCFYANALSYLAVLAGLLAMRLPPAPPRPRGSASADLHALGEGVRYIFGAPLQRTLVVVTTAFSIFGFAFISMLPVFARDVLGSDSAGYGLLMSAVGVGAAAGAIGAAVWGGRFQRERLVLPCAMGFGAILVLAGLAPHLWVAALLLVLGGFAWVLMAVFTNSTLQITSPDALRGRVMGFYSFMVVGLAPIGSFQMGWVAEHLGARTAFMVGGVVCLLVAASARFIWARRHFAAVAATTVG
ncbi:MAG TPA: MFS transporter [Gemmatimonadales bacterium]|jgi:MFS family permease|nr:MFS transporter [Gemmatimonadales bacterium]